MEYTGRNSQTTIDVAIQQCGSLEAVYALALRNNVEITDDVQERSLTYTDEDVRDTNVVSMLRIDGIIPAGKLRGQTVAGGIGYWTIGVNFIIS